MPLRIGLATCAHLHVLSYLHALSRSPNAAAIGIWDHDPARGKDFAERNGLSWYERYDELLAECDAVIVVSENNLHAEHVLAAIAQGKHVLCEKPLVTQESDGEAIVAAAEEAGVCVMTAFPCRFSPAWNALKDRVGSGELGRIRAISATNRGRCPGGWFVEPALSGGGAMIDHVVHVADLLNDLLSEEPLRVQAQVGNNMYGQTWDDTAMLTLEYRDGVFATLDSSWSRPSSYKTWGDVTMTLVGDDGIVEMDMFGQELQHFHSGDTTHTVAGYGSDLDALLIAEFIDACENGRPPLVTAADGLAAARVALAGYRSVETGDPVALS